MIAARLRDLRSLGARLSRLSVPRLRLRRGAISFGVTPFRVAPRGLAGWFGRPLARLLAVLAVVWAAALAWWLASSAASAPLRDGLRARLRAGIAAARRHAPNR